MGKISYEHYLSLLYDIDTAEEDILEYSIFEPGKGFDVTVRPNPNLVLMSDEQLSRENAMKIGNGIARWRRRSEFNNRIKNGVNLPILVSEGDSWFQFPFLIKDIIDHLKDDYLIWSLGAAADTAQNMVFNSPGKGKTEYMASLRRQKKNKIRGFLFSAAGNDIIGENPATEESMLLELLKPFNGNVNDVAGHIDQAVLDSRLLFLRRAYELVIGNVHGEFPGLPIFIHGYDYCFPYPDSPRDPRHPKHTTRARWLAPPMQKRDINDQGLRRKLIKNMLDQLYAMMGDMAGDSSKTNVHLVDCRNSMPAVEDWVDEIHGTSDGFVEVADRFRTAIRNAGIQ